MKEKIEQGYEKLGININTNKIVKQYIDLLVTEKELFRKQFELFHMDLLLGLNNIKEIDEKSFDRYINSINQTKGKLNFWGEKFEVYMHSKLIQKDTKIIKNLKRGVDGIEPDLIFDFNSDSLGIELTTAKFSYPPKKKEHILSKITDKILEKNNKPYSNEKCALIIDVTNIIAYEKTLNLSLNEIFRELYSGFEYLNKEIKFGMVILCNSVYKQQHDGTLKHRLNPRIGLMSETKTIDNNLKNFLSILFNNFQPDDNYDLKFHHLYI